jgi:hypothetical protein
LSPAAGVGIGRLLADKLCADPDFVPAMLEAAKGALKADRTVWEKGPGGVNTSTTEADHKTRLQAFALLLAHMEGEPIRRQVVQHLGLGETVDPEAALQASPALRKAAQHLIDRANAAEKRASGRKSGPAELVIDE